MFWLPGHSNRTRECFCCPQYRVFYCFVDLAKFLPLSPFEWALQRDRYPSGYPPSAPAPVWEGEALAQQTSRPEVEDAAWAKSTQLSVSGFPVMDARFG